MAADVSAAELASLDTTSSISTALGTKQASSAVLDRVVTADLSAAELASLDTTSSIATALGTKQASSAVLDRVVAANLSADELAALDVSSSISTSLAAKADDSVVIKKTGAQNITQSSGTAVLTLENSTGDAPILSCVGNDGTISLSGGNVLTCNRAGAMYIRSTDGQSNISMQSKGSTKLVFDDLVRSKVDLCVENQKKVKFYEASGGGTNSVSLRAPAAVSSDVSFTLPAADGSSGQVLSTDASGNLSFVDNNSVSLSAANVWTAAQTFNGVVLKTTRQYDWEEVTSSYQDTDPYDMVKEKAYYLYNNPTEDTAFQLPNDAPAGTQMWVFTCSKGNSTGRVKFFTDGSQKLYKTDQTDNKGTSGLQAKKNGTNILTLLISGSDGVWIADI